MNQEKRWGKGSKQREQQVERPQKKSVPGILKEEGGPGSCKGVKWGKAVGDEVGGLAGGRGGGGGSYRTFRGQLHLYSE